jgi:hypothetical protein
MRVFFLQILALLLYSSSPVLGELIECDGVWIDKPCSGSAGQVLEQLPKKTPPTAEQRLLESKKQVVQELVNANYDARGKYRIDFSTRAVETECRRPEISLSECRTLVDTAHTKLLTRIKSAQAEIEATRENKIAQNDYETQINIIDNRLILFPPVRLLPHSQNTSIGHREGSSSQGTSTGHREGPFKGYDSRWK